MPTDRKQFPALESVVDYAASHPEDKLYAWVPEAKQAVERIAELEAQLTAEREQVEFEIATRDSILAAIRELCGDVDTGGSPVEYAKAMLAAEEEHRKRASALYFKAIGQCRAELFAERAAHEETRRQLIIAKAAAAEKP